jgi:SAM-dependent methyltransferase
MRSLADNGPFAIIADDDSGSGPSPSPVASAANDPRVEVLDGVRPNGRPPGSPRGACLPGPHTVDRDQCEPRELPLEEIKTFKLDEDAIQDMLKVARAFNGWWRAGSVDDKAALERVMRAELGERFELYAGLVDMLFGKGYLTGDDSDRGHLPDNPLTDVERTKMEVMGVIRYAGLEAGDMVGDFPCGAGRHSLLLAQLAMLVVGGDINPVHLAAAKSKGGELVGGRKAPKFEEADMRDLSEVIAKHGQFKALINMFYSFGFFPEEADNIKVAEQFFAALEDGGKLIIHTDVNMDRVHDGTYRCREVRDLINGMVLRVIDSYNEETRRMDGLWVIEDQEGNVERIMPYSVRVYTSEEWVTMLEAVGFKDVKLYAGWDGQLLENAGEDIFDVVVVAKKPNATLPPEPLEVSAPDGATSPDADTEEPDAA